MTERSTPTSGIDDELLSALRVAIEGAQDAESRWVTLRDRSASDQYKDVIAEGESLRRDLVAAARWSLRDNDVALSTLSAIADHNGIEDLTQDLNDLAELIARNREAFAADHTFEAGAAGLHLVRKSTLLNRACCSLVHTSPRRHTLANQGCRCLGNPSGR